MQLKLCDIYYKRTYKTTQWLTQTDIDEHIKRGYTVTPYENINRNIVYYTIFAYDKDNDILETLEENVREDVLSQKLERYLKYLKRDQLRNDKNEPFDWLEIRRED